MTNKTHMITHPSLTHPSLTHGFFTRVGGVSAGVYASLNVGVGSNDVALHVLENRAIAARAFGVEHDALATVKQVHSANVVVIDSVCALDAREEADAMVTRARGIMLGILTADCAPVLLADRQAGVIGAAHAGWKGAAYGVLEATIDAMENLGARRGDICAVVGPCIAQGSYEVGAEFYERLMALDAAYEAFFIPSPHVFVPPPLGLGGGLICEDGEIKAPLPSLNTNSLVFKPLRGEGKYQFNLPAFVVHRLEKAGLRAVHDIAMDTMRDEELFFSYRRKTLRKEADYGRQLSAIMLAT